MTRLILLLGLLALAAPVHAQPKPAPAPQADPITLFSDSDEAMNAATAEAVSTLPLFFTHAMGPDGRALPLTALKVAMSAVGGGQEVIWVSDVSRTATGFGGYLANAPADLGALREGDYVEFSESQIRDWSYRDATGLRYGHYTTRVIAALPGNEYLWPLLSTDPIPAGWR